MKREIPVVGLSDEMAAKCEDYAHRVAEHFGSGDVLDAMPWTSHLLTLQEFEQWLETRKAAGRAIDIEACEYVTIHGDDDSYGYFGRKFPETWEERQAWVTVYVRSPESRGWIAQEDLPDEKYKALFARREREWKEYCRANPDDPQVTASK
jgi:hypothetical protein